MSKANQEASQDFSAVTEALRKILQPYENDLVLTASEPGQYSLNTRHVLPNKQVLFFAGVQPRKAYCNWA